MEDHFEFWQNLMPRCMPMIFSGLESEARSSLLSSVFEGMADILQNKTDDKETYAT